MLLGGWSGVALCVWRGSMWGGTVAQCQTSVGQFANRRAIMRATVQRALNFSLVNRPAELTATDTFCPMLVSARPNAHIPWHTPNAQIAQ
jgi:hypothetical protein